MPSVAPVSIQYSVEFRMQFDCCGFQWGSGQDSRHKENIGGRGSSALITFLGEDVEALEGLGNIKKCYINNKYC